MTHHIQESPQHGEPDANHLVKASREALTLALEAGRLHDEYVEVLLSNLTCVTCSARALVWMLTSLARSEADIMDVAHGAMVDIINRHLYLPPLPAHPDSMYTQDILSRRAAHDAEPDSGSPLTEDSE